MGLISSFRNLRKVLKRLKRTKMERVKSILQDYGLRELLRRVADKMKHGDAMSLYGRNYIIINESYLAASASLKPFACEREIRFSLAPQAFNISKIEVLTCNSAHKEDAKITLRINDMEGNPLGIYVASNIADYGYTMFDFFPVPVAARMPIQIVLTSDTPGCGVLVNRKKAKRGFTVEGGGSVACKVYTRLDMLYAHWLKNNTPTERELTAQREHPFAYRPKISIIVPLFNTPEQYFREMADSVRAQTYTNWELCLADGSTEENCLAAIAAEYDDERIRYQKLGANEGISGNSNRGIAMATGAYIALLDHDDTLAPQALYSFVVLLNEDAAYDFLYSDEDKVSMDGTRYFDPFFKPDYSPDTLMAFNYITHFTLIKKSLLDEVGWFDGAYNGAQDYDLFLRATERARTEY